MSLPKTRFQSQSVMANTLAALLSQGWVVISTATTDHPTSYTQEYELAWGTTDAERQATTMSLVSEAVDL